MTLPSPALVGTTPMSEQRTSEQRTGLDAEFAEVMRVLTAVVAGVEQTRHPDLDLLASAVPGCVRVTGLLAALTGALGEHAQGSETATGLLDVAADLATMRSLLHRATLVAAPAIADLRHRRHTPTG